MNSIVNIAAYKFVSLDALPGRRIVLKDLCDRLHLKGTILLSPEGINMFLAGTREAIDEYLTVVRGLPEFADLDSDDFSLLSSSPARKLGFTEIPFDKIGLYTDEYRTKPLPARDERRDRSDDVTEEFSIPK